MSRALRSTSALGDFVPVESRGPRCAQDGHIFVSIAAYADPELPATMMSLLAAADRPELIRFGIAAGQQPWK
eukprot:Skav231457  [mRNA]  locus=scaffold1847:867339:867554:- [translate_table: standard]